jgi:epoxide hydrolase-like predicted phosphatase
MAIKNVVFDMGNVLLAYTPENYVHQVIQNPEAAQAVLKELFYGPEWIALDAGTITEEQAVLQVQARIPRFANDVQHAMDLWHSDLTPMPGMPEIISDLKKRHYKLFLLSNTSLRFLKYYRKVEMFRKLDGFVISAQEKLLKPDPAIYHCLCNRYDLLPEECLFIDDLQKNVEGAIACGWSAHRFTDAKELRQFLEQQGILDGAGDEAE